MTDYEPPYEIVIPEAGGEVPLYTHKLEPDMFDEPMGEFPDTDLENLVR